jgi:ribosomal protein L16 Arg81 hydroxylase
MHSSGEDAPSRSTGSHSAQRRYGGCVDVFVLQISGTKRWRLYDGGFALALPEYPCRRGTKPGRIAEEFDLEPGDLIYIPRGVVHSATARRTASLHLTVGIHAIPWATVLAGVLASEVKRNRRLRESLPPGFDGGATQRESAVSKLKHLLASIASDVDFDAIIDDAAQASRRGALPSLEGHLEDLVALDRIDSRTSLQRRADVDCRVTEDKRGMCLQFHGKELRLPASMAPAVRSILARQRFRASALTGDLNEMERLNLLRCLVREGLLTATRLRTTSRRFSV